MHKLLALFLLPLLALACAAAHDTEPLGEVDEALYSVTLGSTTGTCPRPTGGPAEDQGMGWPPTNRNVTAVLRNPANDHSFIVETTEHVTGTVFSDTIDFGENQGWIRDSGWTGPKLSQLLVGAPGAGCFPADPRYGCIVFRGTGSTDGQLMFRSDRSAPTWSGTSNHGRVFAIRGLGAAKPQGLRFWSVNEATGELIRKDYIFDGTRLNSCANP